MSDPGADDLGEALHSARRIMAGDPRDWSADRHDAFLYGLFQGWDCEESHTHGPSCPRIGPVAERHGWDGAFVQRLRRLRAAVRSAQPA